MKRNPRRSPFLRFLFLVYCSIMLWLLFGRSWGWDDGLSYRQILQGNINITPFYTIKNYLHVLINRSNDEMLVHCFINLAGNVILFIPLGYLLPKIFARQENFFRFFLTCTLSILLVELVQLFTLLGSFDIDDLILNLCGMIIGFIYYHLTKKK